ncbi:MAG: hypothetical protein JWQ23_4250 [Herminiimonas sp.]|nr:hypothetical protein [Herminiimonas sp.]
MKWSVLLCEPARTALCSTSATWAGCTIAKQLALAILVLIALSALPFPAGAQDSTAYSVEIIGAGDLRPLLEQNLDIIRRAADSGVGIDELQRRVSVAPQQIRELLATEGYFSPVIEGTLDQTATPPVARFNINPGKPVTIDSVDIKFIGDIAANLSRAQRVERLRRQWSLQAGERFRQAEWDEAKGTLLKGLLNRDYPAARIASSEARIDPAQGTAQLKVEADSGPAFTFGELQIQGLERYSRDKIDALNPIKPGSPYSQESLNELQARLQDTGYFRSAFTTIEVDPNHPDRVPVRVDVSENERKRLQLGVGFSTDTGANVRVKWLDRQFLGRDWRTESELKLDRLTRTVKTDLYLPPIGNGWLPSFGAAYERTDINREINDKINTSARLTSPDKNNEQSWAALFFVDRQKVPDLEPNNRRALVASYTYTRRRLDRPLSPQRGYVASAELAAGPRGLLNQQNIGRVLAQATWLHPFDRRWNTVLRAQGGQVFGAPRETIPDDLLFRTGGDQKVRGYAYNSLGVPLNGAIVGGRVLAVLSAELVYQITPQWGAAVFHDAGNAADSWRGFRLRQGSGVGARWRSPIGPVNLDLAFAHETREPRLHFSVGYGF